MTRRTFLRFARDRRGVSAVEFAVMAPVLISLFFGGFVIIQATTISRKVTITTRALADLTSQYTTMSASDMTTVMNATKQIIAPYSATPLSIRISQMTTSSNGKKATIDWSVVNSGSTFTAYNNGDKYKQMPNIGSTSFLHAEVSYVYTPPIATSLFGTLTLSDDIFMLPRLSSSVTYSGS